MGDVAREAGVSVTTVSHTISGARQVSKQVRARVEQAMTDLGYVPSRAGRNLATGVSNVIGLLVPDIGNSFFAELAKGAERAASDRGYNVIFGNTDFDHARDLLYLEAIRSRAIDGLVYAAGSPMSTAEIGRALGTVPIVLVDEEVEGVEAPLVISDNERGGELVAEHLLELGHRSALVIGATRGLRSGDLRLDGFQRRWSAAGGICEVVWGGFTEPGGRAALLEYEEEIRSGRITAVFAANDVMALAVIQLLESWDVCVPEQVSVAGFDDITVARLARPALTTVSQDPLGMGRAAVEILVDSLSTGEPLQPHRRVFDVELIARQTTAPAVGEGAPTEVRSKP